MSCVHIILLQCAQALELAPERRKGHGDEDDDDGDGDGDDDASHAPFVRRCDAVCARHLLVGEQRN